MNEGTRGTTHDLPTKRLYHGTRAGLSAGNRIEVGQSTTGYVGLTPNLDEAIWDAELAPGEQPARVYTVESTGDIGHVSGLADWKSPGHPSMSWYSREPLRVTGEVTEWLLYHGTRAQLKPGDLIKPGHNANFGEGARTARHVYFSRTLEASMWGAELAAGDDRGRIYIVEPTGPVEDDPNLTNKKFRGNPTKSFRSREPLRVIGEVADWQGHSPETIQAMKDGLEKLKQLGSLTIDD